MKILVVVDLQNDFIDGTLGTPEAKAIVPKVVQKIEEFDGDQILYTMDTHYGDYFRTQEGRMLPIPHCVVGRKGWKICDAVNHAIQHNFKPSGYPKFTDYFHITECFIKSAFGCPDLAIYLEEIYPVEEVVLIGLCTDICVLSNAIMLKSFLPEAKITVDASCCAGTTPEKHNIALSAMQACQIYIENWNEKIMNS